MEEDEVVAVVEALADAKVFEAVDVAVEELEEDPDDVLVGPSAALTEASS